MATNFSNIPYQNKGNLCCNQYQDCTCKNFLKSEFCVFMTFYRAFRDQSSDLESPSYFFLSNDCKNLTAYSKIKIKIKVR